MNIDEVLDEKLTPDQKAAAIDTANEILCLACAGSGKSRTTAYRIAWLVANGEAPDSIVAFTFTEKAADSIKRRVAEALQSVGISTDIMGAMYIGTIHGYCQHLLGQIDAIYRQFDVLDENRLVLYLVSRYPSLGVAGLRARARGNSYFAAIKETAGAWKTINDEMLEVEDVQQYDPELYNVIAALRDGLVMSQYIDFSLMIRLVADAMIAQHPGAEEATANLRHLLVDEYQDVSPAQEALIQELHSRSESLFVVGDDDQAIYAWRGADVSNILNFTSRFPQASQHELAINFRSTDAIVDTANRFAADELGASRIEKTPAAYQNITPRDFGIHWFDRREDEGKWVAQRIAELIGTAYVESDGEVRGLTPGDFAILMRSTRVAEMDGSPRHAAFTNALVQRDIKYSLESGGGPFERPQVSALRDSFNLLRQRSPSRGEVQALFNDVVIPAYPQADFNALARLMTHWGRLIHTPRAGARRRVYPQQLVHDLLEAFNLAASDFSDEVMRDIGLFSRMLQDVESVYMSVDSVGRFREILNFLENVADSGYDVSTDDVVQRPDAVFVSTVHKAKGLEFPVVFVVDAVNARFPKNKSKYSGFLPDEMIRPAIDRGAYHSTRDEEARLYYTAITRAERFLYISGAGLQPGGKRPKKTSAFTLRLQHDEIRDDSATLPAGLTQAPQRQRVDEVVLPTSFSDIKYYLRCPMDYRFRKGFGFSPPIPEMFGFGQTVHTAVGKLHEEFSAAQPTQDEAAAVAEQVFHLKHVPPSNDPQGNPGPYERAKEKAVDIVKIYAETYGDEFVRNRQIEARFEIPAQDSVISGAIDLLLKQGADGEIVEAEVVDFKAIEGGVPPEENPKLNWDDLSLQVQLYAKAAREVLGENAQTGSVHLLKDNQRVNVPVDQPALDAAVANVEWAVQGILSNDFPSRPAGEKCRDCDWGRLCPKEQQRFSFTGQYPPELSTPQGMNRVAACCDPDDED
ncbi:DNA helicase-2 / ATP-dependent DNA helicase PcrA [Paucidesulfovibrio gracilis DSM 16080]|uniref:DNA 3'-5' helicase n=1 Tax=Paucidesulfovibrio gracilis DSM 16080 TaxID=1121449 RepID=A0A1T4W4X3_9BACT|nr:ATP-dependent DNA helicase [Paucidesulfovibrio gracilis]SKA72108.1 DNA helicase-2 / ATP-dependent DNA helicase PcrA [Paucidesulfovibrio gracilis DSM 16080]